MRFFSEGFTYVPNSNYQMPTTKILIISYPIMKKIYKKRNVTKILQQDYDLNTIDVFILTFYNKNVK